MLHTRLSNTCKSGSSLGTETFPDLLSLGYFLFRKLYKLSIYDYCYAHRVGSAGNPPTR